MAAVKAAIALVASTAGAVSIKSAASQAWQSYTRALATRPFSTRMTTSGVILGFADYTCQKIEGKEQVNPRRVAAMAATGFFMVGPCVHTWYSFLGRMFGEKSTWQVVGKKLALDQAFFAPAMFGLIMSSQGLLSGRSWEDNKRKLEAEWFNATKRGWCVFSVANGINFAFVPAPFRLLYNNGISFCWNTYLSNVNNSRMDKPTSASPLVSASTLVASVPAATAAAASPAPAPAVAAAPAPLTRSFSMPTFSLPSFAVPQFRMTSYSSTPLHHRLMELHM